MPTGLSRHTVFLERAKAESGRDELAVKITLAAYLVVRLVDAYFVVLQSDRGREEFKWQFSAVRRHLSELPADQTEVGHLASIVDAVASANESVGPLRIGLTAYAYFLEHDGRFGEALEIVLLASRAHGSPMQPVDFAACALFAARLNRLLARWDEASAYYKAAEAAAEVAGDPVLRLRGRLGQGAVCRGQGNLPRAQAIAQHVLEEAKSSELVEVQLIAYSDLSSVYGMQGKKLEALNADYQAFLLSPDTIERMRALNNVGVGFIEIGAYDAARLAFDIVIRSGASFWIRYNALLELMDTESTVGNRVAFERLRMQAEAEKGRMPPTMVVDYLRKTGVGFARFGQLKRAREVLGAALAFAESHRLNAWYFKIEAAMQDIERAVLERRTQAEPFADLEQAPVVQQMEAGLREYAALQPA